MMTKDGSEASLEESMNLLFGKGTMLCFNAFAGMLDKALNN